MDPVTHVISGGLLGKSSKRFFRSKRIVLFCIIAAWIPDVDNLTMFINPKLYLMYHRGITHSFIGGFGLAILLACFFWRCCSTKLLFKGIFLAYIGILLHIFLDLVTSFGTKVFYPFSDVRYSIPCVFVIDPVFTLIAGGFLFISYRCTSLREKAAMLGLVWLLLYPLANLGIRYELKRHLKDELRLRKISYVRLEILPDILAPVNWKLILETPEDYQMAGIHLGRSSLLFERYRKVSQILIEELARQDPFSRSYANFIKYPVIREEREGRFRTIVLSDLRFYSAVSFVRDFPLVASGASFSILVKFDKNGRLVAYRFPVWIER